MSVQNFLSAVLPTQGHRFGVVHFGKQGDPGFRPSQKVFDVSQTEDLIGFCNWGDANGGNAYFAVGGFQPGVGAEMYRRTAANAVFHRCLRADIDVGEHKAYTTKRDALYQLFAMVAHYGMPAPWVVDSGGGIHAYWTFDRDVTLAEWLPLAGRLAAAFAAFGLHADTTTTLDAARILRLPGTHNHKPAYAEPPAVRLLQEGVSAPPEQVVLSLPAAAFNTSVPAALRGQQDELSANLHQPYFLRDMLKGCPGLLAMVGNGGRFAQEPLWKSALDLINKSDDDEALKQKVARGISCGHPGFTEEGLATKWQQVVRQDYHPPTCSRMASAGMPECASCPQRGRISSPLVLGRFTATAPAFSPLPAPTGGVSPVPPASPPSPVVGAALVVAPLSVFVFDAAGYAVIADVRLAPGVCIQDGLPCITSKPKGSDVFVNTPLLRNRMLRVRRMLDDTRDTSAIEIVFDRGNDGTKAVELSGDDLSDAKAFNKKMNGNGLYINATDANVLREKFMPSFLDALRHARAASMVAGRCGWTDNQQSFVLGSMVYNADGSAAALQAQPGAGMDGYTTAGDEATWRKAFDVALSGGVDRQCMLAMFIAGPLMEFSDKAGVLLNMYSPESGVGKTTVSEAGLSIWGCPAELIVKKDDTANATFKLAGVSGNIPMLFDEVTYKDGKALAEFVHTLTDGREKRRCMSDASLQSNTNRWRLAGVSTSNRSVHEKLQAYSSDAVAAAARVFEIRAEPLHLTPEQLSSNKTALAGLSYSHGFLGPVLAKLFVSKPVAHWKQQVEDRVAWWDKNTSANTGGRYWSIVCALVELGAEIGHSLGYAFNVDAVRNEMVRHGAIQTKALLARHRSPVDMIRDYVMRNRANFVVFGGASGNECQNEHSMHGKIMGEQRGTMTGNTYAARTVMIPYDLLREHVQEQNGSFTSIQEWIDQQQSLAKPMVLRHGMMEFLAGTKHMMSVRAIQLDAVVINESATTLTVVPSENSHASQAQR